VVARSISRDQVLEWLSEVPDPEIPVLTIADLGILRDVTVDDDVVIALSPTYTGCPATEMIEQSVIDTLRRHGIENVSIDRVLSPPWTTDWISEDGREKLREYGIAPPEQGASKRTLLQGERSIACPRCQSQDTEVVSEFGSTACKAAYKCKACLEPFEYFKCI
jgi:ring-1,2-phenylacetyl-CoA epoxidase subunit PaaD